MMTEEEFSVIENEVKQVFEKYRVSHHRDGDKAVLEGEIKSIFKEKGFFCPVVEFTENGLDEIINLKEGNDIFFEAKRPLRYSFSYRIRPQP